MRNFVQQLLFTLLPCVGLTLPASGCQDVDGHPLSVVAPETHGAVALGGRLPSVPELMEAHGLEAEGLEELAAWRDSWALRDDDGALVRTRHVYPAMAARLYPLLNRSGVEKLLQENEESLRSAKGMGILLANEKVARAREEALQFHHEALSVLRNGDGERALRLALQSADAMREVAPQQVALELLEQARAHLRRNQDPDAYSGEKLTRIQRLTNGAAEALKRGDYPRAIRRAYYACQLLGAEPG